MAGNSTPEGAAKALESRWTKYHADPEQWFWPKVDRTGGPEACWPWMGRIEAHRRGYGRVQYKRRLLSAHRMALVLTAGEPADPALVACHTCDNSRCCNPAHLWWGSDAENDADARSKGRKTGPHPRLIDLDRVWEMRAQGMSYAQLATAFGVNQASIGKALKKAACLRARTALEGGAK